MTMEAVEVLRQTVREQDGTSGDAGYSTWIFIATILMMVLLIYVWSHIHMTELEYQIARELSSREQFTEEQAKLKVELATLRSPQRIETIAREKLQMTYPGREQVILLK
jgi:cell division protein FtsL